MDPKVKGVPQAPNIPVPTSKDDDDDDDDDQPPRMEPGYDSSDNKDINDEPDDPLGRPRLPLIRRSDDDEDNIIVEDILEDDELLKDSKEEADVIPEPRGRGMQTRAPPATYQTSFRGQLYPGSLFLQVPVHHYALDSATRGYKTSHEGNALLNVHAGAGYKAQRNMSMVQGIINLNLGEKPTLPPLTEAQVEDHIMGVVFLNNIL